MKFAGWVYKHNQRFMIDLVTLFKGAGYAKRMWKKYYPDEQPEETEFDKNERKYKDKSCKNIES